MKDIVRILSGELRCSEDEIDDGLYRGDAEEWGLVDELGQMYEDDALPDEGLAPWEPDWDDD